MAQYSERSMDEIQAALAAATPPDIIEWKPVDVRFHDTDGGFSALALAYADARFVQSRLDEVVGAFNWQTKAEVVSSLLLVGIAIRNPKIQNEWIWKWDTGQGGEEDRGSGYGGGKGLFSQGFKRAAYQWGIARDLYALPTPRCRCKGYTVDNGKKHLFRGWTENPWLKAESIETGRPHRSQVERRDPSVIKTEPEQNDTQDEPAVDFIPANSTTYFALAYTKVKIDRDQATESLQPFIDKTSGEIDYAKAIMTMEMNLPETDRDFTIQQAELSKKEKEESGKK